MLLTLTAATLADGRWPEAEKWHPITVWTPSQGEDHFAATQADHHMSFTIAIGDDDEVGWPHAYHVLAEGDSIAGTSFAVRGKATLDNLRDGYGAMLSLMFFDKENKRIANSASHAAPDMPGTVQLRAMAIAPEGTRQVRAAMLLNGRGTVRFHEVEWTRDLPAETPAPGTQPRLTVTGAGPWGQRMVGFGAEDDGWFYNAQNREMGVDDAAIALREKRIDWLSPDWTRMFFWYEDWDPGLTGDNFTFDSDNMQSKYRSLALYEELGTHVSGCGVDWGLRDRYDDPERVARSVGALLEHLVKEKGFTCIRDWTFMNEPNHHFTQSGYGFEHFIAIHRALRDEFDRRGLDVKLMGSDDGDGMTWFAACVEDPAYRKLVDSMASHVYLDPARRPFAWHFARERTSLLQAYPEMDRMPFVLAEFGLADARMQPPATNPFMREYDYALEVMAAIIDMLHAGAAGASLWCLHEVYYPGGKTPMEFGLWNFGGDWQIRPVYHALGVLTHTTEPGERYRTLEVDAAAGEGGGIRVAAVGDNLLFANRANQPGALTVAPGAPCTLTFPRAFTEAMPMRDDYAGERLEKARDGTISLPPRSFGYARVTWHDWVEAEPIP